MTPLIYRIYNFIMLKYKMDGFKNTCIEDAEGKCWLMTANS